MSVALKYANTTTSVRHGDRIMRIAEGDPWHAGDPFVVARPDLFSDTPPRVFGEAPRVSGEVERATAAPGEKRAARRA